MTAPGVTGLPVDVLAVLDLAACRERDAGMPDGVQVAARAAVAELIEAAAEVRAAHRELPSTDQLAAVREAGEARIGRAHYALEAALARVGGAG